MSEFQIMLMNIIFILIPFVNSYICYIKYDYHHNKLLNYNPTIIDNEENKISDRIMSIISKENEKEERIIPLNLHNFDKPINYSRLYEDNPMLVYMYFGDIICDSCNYYPKNYDEKLSILITGDSYAIQWLWIIRKYASVRNLTLRYYFISFSDLLIRKYEVINSYFHIIIPIFSAYQLIIDNTYDTFVERYKEFVFLCSKKSDILIAFADHPMSRINRDYCVCAECIKRKLPICYTINGINSTYVDFPPMLNIPNYHIINIMNELCVNGICSCVIDDYLVYDDHHHINPSILLKFSSTVENELDKILNNEYPVVRKYNVSDKCSLLIMNYVPFYCKRYYLQHKSITREYNDYYYSYNKTDYPILVEDYRRLIEQHLL